MSKRQYDFNGWMYVDDNPITKEGVFPYLGKEIGAPEPNRVYYVYRPAEELQKQETIDSFKLLPFIDDHEMLGKDATPAEKKGVAGMIGENVRFEQPYLKGNLKILANRVLDKINSGKIELSAGYYSTYDFESGAFNGQRYDAVQRNIRANHLALVDKGRSGADVAIQDRDIFTIDTKELVDMTLEDIKNAIAALSDEEKQRLLSSLSTSDEKKDEENEDEADEESLADAVADLEEVAESVESAIEAVEEAVATGEESDVVEAEAAIEEVVEKAEEAEEAATMDAMRKEIAQLKRKVASMDSTTVMKQIASRDKLVGALKPFVGTFDHSTMTASDVARYGVKKLGIKCAKGEEFAALKGYLQAKIPDAKKPTASMDSASYKSVVDKWKGDK